MKYCICKMQSQNSFFQPTKNFYFQIFSPGRTMAIPIIDAGYKGMSSTGDGNFLADRERVM